MAAKAGCEQIQESERQETGPKKQESTFSSFAVKKSREIGIGWREDVRSRQGFISVWFCVMGEMIACLCADGKVIQKSGGGY